ncbi:hypothetical protein CapIbe_015967 [Capra ibex]
MVRVSRRPGEGQCRCGKVVHKEVKVTQFPQGRKVFLLYVDILINLVWNIVFVHQDIKMESRGITVTSTNNKL